MDDAAIDREIRAAAEQSAIPVADAWLAGVREHLKAIRAAADLVESFPLPDEIDQAPVFEA